MYRKKIPISGNCGLDLAAAVLYGKWKIKLLYFINQGFCRPSELQLKLPGAAPRVLHMQLNELEAHEIIRKTIFAEVPLRVEYTLTSLGESLMPVLGSLGAWADEHASQLRDSVLENVESPAYLS